MKVNLKCVIKAFGLIAILASLTMPAFAAGEHVNVTGGVVFPLTIPFGAEGDSIWNTFIYDYRP